MSLIVSVLLKRAIVREGNRQENKKYDGDCGGKSNKKLAF